MIYTTPINLISVVQSQDEMGNIIETETSRQVYVRSKSVGAREFYNADINGWKVETEFDIFKTDYRGEKYIEFDGHRLVVIRTVAKDGFYLALVCGQRVGKE